MLQGVTMRQNSGHGQRQRGSALLAGALSLLFVAAGSAYGQIPGVTYASTVEKPITLQEAIHRAQANEPAFAASSAESRAAALDRSIARAGLLPGVVYHNQAL